MCRVAIAVHGNGVHRPSRANRPSRLDGRAERRYTMLTVEDSCPLCGGISLVTVEVHGKRYLDCATCRLVHLATAHRLDAARERAHYTTHRNDPADAGYRAFLNRVATPLVELLEPGAAGLDYGSGPGPTLSVLLTEKGFSVALYDPFFDPDPAPLGRTYDFITCTETAEHFFEPSLEFARLRRLLRPGGILAVMTEVLRDDTLLDGWWYLRDPTHVSFYRPETFEWLGEHHGFSHRFVHRNVSLLRAETLLPSNSLESCRRPRS
jgi:SAM-dependent methyltransferase